MRKWIGRIVVIVIAGVFLYSAWHLIVIRQRYKVSEDIYNGAVAEFTRPGYAAPASAQGAPGAFSAQDGPEIPEEPEEHVIEYAPIIVDFDALLEVNEDVIGWLYCADTVISYPIVHGDDNLYYLEHSYNFWRDPTGTIFSDAQNRKGFVDSNIILYGHHMQNKTIFYILKYWLKQDYYDEHPVMWMLTPERDYKIELYSAHKCDAKSETYTIYYWRDDNFVQYLDNAVKESEIVTDVVPDPDAMHLVLSTCAYAYELERMVLHGQMVPVDSAGGIPLAMEE